jgi:multicomponent Na+:H+ antiporter subunit E
MNRAVLFMLLMLFCVMLTWPADPPNAAYLQDLGTGAAVALLVTWIMGGPAEGAARWLQPTRYFWALAYLFVLSAYIVKANFEVAYRALHPAMPIHPGIVKVRTHLRRPSSRTALCNSITLTPGTLTVDIHADGTMMVHWINVLSLDEEEAARRILGRFEWFIARILE